MTSKKIEDGGPAFPQLDVTACVRDGHGDLIEPFTSASGGMSLRDHFAGQAVQAAITGHFSHYGHENYWAPKDIADYAYDVADAMIARKGGA